jgi:hypothetical protein
MKGNKNIDVNMRIRWFEGWKTPISQEYLINIS